MAIQQQLPALWQLPTPWTARRGLWLGWLAVNLAILVLVCLPLCAFLYIIPRWRPDPRWTWRQATCVRPWRFHFHVTPSIRPRFAAPCQPGQLGGPVAVFETVRPASPNLLGGVLDPHRTAVRAEPRPAVWYPTRFDPAHDGNTDIVLHLMGGAYVLGTHTSDAYKTTYDELLTALAPAKVFAVGYRLASTKGCHFPAQLMDALAAYSQLLKQHKIPAMNIILLGDSAGGNLAITRFYAT